MLGKRIVLSAVIAVAAVATGMGTAFATEALPTSTSPAPKAVYACEGTGHVVVTPLSSPSRSCQTGSSSIVIGAQGATGKQGPSGVVSAGIRQLKLDDGTSVTEPTGGSFAANSVEVGTGVFLRAGTYLVSLSAKATPSSATGVVEVFPQFFVYDQVKPASGFAGDLFNVGSGALESGTHATIDSYYSGSSLVVLPMDTTLHVYAFGYDSDQGNAGYLLESLSLTAIQINP